MFLRSSSFTTTRRKRIIQAMVTTTLLHSATAAAVVTPPTTTATSPSSFVVKLYSLDSIKGNINGNNNIRIIHLLRHAEGYHNVEKDYKSPTNIDAQLTPKGIQQCQLLSKRLVDNSGKAKAETSLDTGGDSTIDSLYDVDCIISSPMRRALQTAQHSFEHQLSLSENDSNSSKLPPIPFVACEEWRETVNYLCDQRLSSNALQSSFPFVDFQHIQHDIDPIWSKYESQFGPHDVYTAIRESGDDEGLAQRAKLAWEFIKHRKEQNIALVSHSAFFMHVFTRPELGIVRYEDEEVEKLMTERPFENCEMRSIAFEVI